MTLPTSSPRISGPHWPKPGPMKRQSFFSGEPVRMGFLLSRQAVYSSKAISSMFCWRMPADLPQPYGRSRLPTTLRFTPLEKWIFTSCLDPYQTTLAKKDLPQSIAMTSAPALSVDYRASPAGILQPGRGFSPSQTDPEFPAALIEEKLHRLKTWREQGLITDDEYLQKRQEILQRF